MKLAMKLVALMFGALFLANIANAETPREQLKQMVEQLQKNPTDNSLREKIIRIAQEIKPAPAVPEEAERFEGRAQFAFTNAKSLADYLAAAKEYEKAIAVAPWVAGYYSDLCTIYQKAEKYAEAKKSCEFFLASSPSTQDVSDARKRIAGLEFAMEKASSIVEEEKKRPRETGRDGPFIAYNNGTVLDTRTNLMWAEKDNGTSVNWANAKSYSDNYRGGGYTDWRMPTQDELAGLSDAGKTQRSNIEHDLTTRYLTKLIYLFPCCLWAAETRGSEAAIFNFESGKRFWKSQSFDNYYRALPVRSGK